MISDMAKERIKAAVFLMLVLNLIFFPALWGNKTLLLASRDVPSITDLGAFPHENYRQQIGRTSDPGAPAWTIEPWLKIMSDQIWQGHELPLWNPDAAYGKPLAAAQQAQPFYPLTFLLTLDVTPHTYDFFIVGRLFVAGFLMFLFARLFLELMPSLVASLIYMLSGYFIVFLSMPHLSVEVLTPGILWLFERILRRNDWTAMSLAAAMVCCAALGGMPESLFLAISFGCVFFLFRLTAQREFRNRPFARLAKLVAAMILGFGLSAFFLVPFVEFMQIAQDSHQPGNVHGEFAGLIGDDDLRLTVLYLLPLLFGPVGNSIFGGFTGLTGLGNYWGLIASLLAVVAVFWAFRRDSAAPRAWRGLAVFFAISLALMLLKRFENPAVNWIGALPIARMVLFVKYDEPLIALSVAMLAGIGFALIAERRVGRFYLPVAALPVTLLMLGLALWSLPRVVGLNAHGKICYGAVLAAGGLIMAAAVSWWALASRPPLAKWLAPGLLFLLVAELSADFIIPSFYLFNSLPTQAASPYVGAPYIDFLRAQDRDRSRVFGRERELYPNWAGVFGLSDVRSLDAMEYRPYFAFIRNFLLQPSDEEGDHTALVDRFTGDEPGYDYDFATDRERRFLALSSVKYLISGTQYPVDAPFKQIYDREVRVYEVAGVLPRAAVYAAAEILPDGDVLARLKAPDFDPTRKIILGRDSIPADDATAIHPFTEAPETPVQAARITAYGPQRVRIEADTGAPALLMLNDADYPGWRAWVNGTPAPILRADYLFRAVLLPAGKNTVEFEYAPRSFRLGLAISAVSLIAVLAVPLVDRRRARNDTAPA